MLKGRGGHETVDRGQGGYPAEFTPALCDRSRYRDESVRELRLESVEPRCEGFRLFGVSATPEYLDPMPDLSKREDAHAEIGRFDRACPRGDCRRTGWALTQFAHYVRVEEIPHNSTSRPGSGSRSIGR